MDEEYLRGMLEKYARIVGHNEGTYFLYKSEWTDEEWAVWVSILPVLDIGLA
jgi:hypothetical protein